MPKKALLFAFAAMIGLLLLLPHIVQPQTRVVVINQSGEPIAGANVSRKEFGTIENGQSRASWVRPDEDIVLSFRIRGRVVRWQSPPQGSMVITIRSDGAVDAQRALSGNR